MAEINHFAISSILGSEIAGQASFGHGQLASLSGGQKYVAMLRGSRDSVYLDLRNKTGADVLVVKNAFLAVRNRDGDQKSPDLYVADPSRNSRFIAECRKLGLQESEYVLNKTLLNARRNRQLRDLRSAATRFDYNDYAFASEFAATAIRYETGATIDDLLCHPVLAARFDAIARGLAPGFSSVQYRWAILSIRKAGRMAKWRPEYKMPDLTAGFRLLEDPTDQLPEASGVYILFENDKPLYARSTSALRHGIELHKRPPAIAAIANPFWHPDLKAFTVSYAAIEDAHLLRPVEKKVVEDWKPIFNVLRAAA